MVKNMWKESHYSGEPVAFSPVVDADENLHPVQADAHFTMVETNLYGFNIPEADINCNIYMLWHPLLKTMSAHIFVHAGRRVLIHQLQADYFNDHQYLPAVDDNSDYRLEMGSCRAHIKTIEPLKEILLQFDDPKHHFCLDLTMTAAMPPVGRPGGKHFTQLMKTSGSLLLNGTRHSIDGYYMRDRSWGYQRPEAPELTPPYRWMTGWFGANAGFVVAWIDTGLLDGEAFGPDWNHVVSGEDASGFNKWESGGPTPSLNLRSGWVTRDGIPRQVVAMKVRSLLSDAQPFLVEAIELELEDVKGEKHIIRGDTLSMMPKMYWQNMITNMHLMALECDGMQGHGDLMDTFSQHHIRTLPAVTIC